jgi:hypothetical protein
MFSQAKRRDARNSTSVQLPQAKIFPAKDRFYDARHESARRQHQGRIRGEISCHLNSNPAGPNADRAALPVRCQQKHGCGQNVREQIRKLGGVAKF